MMKNMIKTMAVGLLLAVGLSACATSGPQPAPSTLDKAIFDIQTNVVTVTNTVQMTNTTFTTVTTTNTVGQVTSVTNVVQVPQIVPVVVTQTNYVYAPKATVVDTANVVGAATGPWGTVGAMALSGALGLFAFFKNRQTNTMTEVAGVSQQAVKVAQGVIAALPNGAALAATFNTWLAAHQGDVNIASELAGVMDDYLDPTHQATVAAGIVAQASKPIVVPAAAPVAAPVAVAPKVAGT